MKHMQPYRTDRMRASARKSASPIAPMGPPIGSHLQPYQTK